ncbi:uncharacterized protein LOC121372584 [Gigantopelta aegis]|uniref:uncharacterized protein LOC121372584 n=1 Tax=Gigantopelta aegis TaxID=1735272 RepID=UPI001B88A0E0|nr:uncharacterized protein LOC121372584 [Gigantopelta aegis]
MFFYKCLLLLIPCLLHQVSGGLTGRDKPQACTKPNVYSRYSECPPGYCCVRDEFLPTDIYCKKIGDEGDNCTTRQTESDCPCRAGLYCKPNIQSMQFKSLYGRCTNVTSPQHH